MANLPTGQISNHYELKNWDLFQIPEKEIADEWDGHTPQEAAERLHKYLLEKQGEQKHLTYPIKNNQKSSHCWNNAHDVRPKHLQRCICYDKYMGNVYCYVYDEYSKYWCTQMTEEHDPNGDNHVCDYADYRVTMWMPLPDTSLNVRDKIEPKFNVGDWIANGGAVWCIESIHNGFYYLKGSRSGVIKNSDIKTIDNNFHLWTIKDAKDGDVLKEDSCIFIIERMKPNGTAMVHCCLFDDDDFDLVGSNLSFDADSTYPATKEQRDQLFSKMKEAGYEWDAEKKELKKIEQKPTWSEEDERLRYSCIAHIKEELEEIRNDKFGHSEIILDLKESCRERIKWLESLKERFTLNK